MKRWLAEGHTVTIGALPMVAKPMRLMMDSIEMMNTATKMPTTVEITFLMNDFMSLDYSCWFVRDGLITSG